MILIKCLGAALVVISGCGWAFSWPGSGGGGLRFWNSSEK